MSRQTNGPPPTETEKTASEARLGDDAEKAFAMLLRHLSEGNGGAPWCRFGKLAYDKGYWLRLDWTNNHFNSIREAAFCAADRLEDWAASKPNDQDHYLANVTALISPRLLSPDAERLIQDDRPAHLARGMMVGILHPGSDLCSLTNRDGGFPFRTPEIFLNVRFAVPQDRVFVAPNSELSELLKQRPPVRDTGRADK